MSLSKAPSASRIGKEDMQREVQADLSYLEDYAKQLIATVGLLKQTAGHDINFPVLEESKKLLDEAAATNVKVLIGKIFKTLKLRAHSRLKEIG